MRKYSPEFEELWNAWPKASRNGKIDTQKAYKKALIDFSHEEIMGRLRAFLREKSANDWYNFCWPQKFLNRYIDDYEPDVVIKPYTEWTDEEWLEAYKDKLPLTERNIAFLKQYSPEKWADMPDFIKRPKMEIVKSD